MGEVADSITCVDIIPGVMLKHEDSQGRLHRLNGHAYVSPNGTREWYYHGKRHREDGPAVESPDGCESWYLHGLTPRIGGPAVLDAIDGEKAWWLWGKRFSEAGYWCILWNDDAVGAAVHWMEAYNALNMV